MMDAAEIARLRENLASCPDQLGFMSADDILSLLDELEQARKERDDLLIKRILADHERDSTRALLCEAMPWVSAGTEFESTDAEARALCARIEAVVRKP